MDRLLLNMSRSDGLGIWQVINEAFRVKLLTMTTLLDLAGDIGKRRGLA